MVLNNSCKSMLLRSTDAGVQASTVQRTEQWDVRGNLTDVCSDEQVEFDFEDAMGLLSASSMRMTDCSASGYWRSSSLTMKYVGRRSGSRLRHQLQQKPRPWSGLLVCADCAGCCSQPAERSIGLELTPTGLDYMGSFSLWHWLIVLVMLAIPAAAVVAVVLLVNSRRRACK